MSLAALHHTPQIVLGCSDAHLHRNRIHRKENALNPTRHAPQETGADICLAWRPGGHIEDSGFFLTLSMTWSTRVGPAANIIHGVPPRRALAWRESAPGGEHTYASEVRGVCRSCGLMEGVRAHSFDDLNGPRTGGRLLEARFVARQGRSMYYQLIGAPLR